jgi:hypothetical protein
MLSVLTWKTRNRKTQWKLLEVMDMFITCFVVIVTQVYTYVPNHQIVYILIVYIMCGFSYAAYAAGVKVLAILH